MKKKKIGLACFLAIAVLCTTVFAQRKYVGWSYGYLPDYANFSVSKVNFKCYTYLAWFAVNGNGSGTINGISDATAQTFTNTCHQNNCKAIICVGGAGAGQPNFQPATTTSVMPTFVKNLVAYMSRNGFDGIDIDWEDGINGQFVPFMKALSTALSAITPKPVLTVATAQYLASQHGPAAAYVDQFNLMSYYNDVNSMAGQVASFTSQGIPKSKLGIGYGYDTDNEVDGPNECGNGADGNPTDINAKCLWAINNGCGGVMVWEVDRAPKKCDSVTAFYVNKTVTSVVDGPFASMRHAPKAVFSIVNNAASGINELHYSVLSEEAVNLEIFNMNGALVQRIARGMQHPGIDYSISVGKNNANVSAKPGVYVLKVATPTNNMAGTVVVK